MSNKVQKRFFLDYMIIIPYLILSVLGVIMVYSASPTPAGKLPLEAIKQGGFLILGIISIIGIYKMKTKVFQNKSFITGMIVTIGLLLLLTKFTSLGVRGGGADGWLSLGFISIQPVEFLKIIVIWYLAYILSRRQYMIEYDVKDVMLKPLALVGVLIGLVIIQPDNGGAAILFLITMIMVLSSGINYKYSLLALSGGVIGSYFAILLINLTGGILFPGRLKYVYNRFRTFSNPFIDPLGDGHQMINSYFAMNNGGWFGLGLGQSIQKKGFLINAQTDFMFSIVVEELGLFASLIILGILLFLILRIFLIGIRSVDPFNSMMCIGIGGMILIQTFINVGGVLGIIPLTGVTFPFLSQGGSSLITLSIGIGFALNISADEKRKKIETEFIEKQQLLGYEQTLLSYK